MSTGPAPTSASAPSSSTSDSPSITNSTSTSTSLTLSSTNSPKSTDIEDSPNSKTIFFTKSSVTVLYPSNSKLPILRVAEDAGLDPSFGCRSGMCGTCEVKLVSGEVDGPEGDYEGGILICCSRPISQRVEIEL